MPTNIEIKFRVADQKAIERRVADIADSEPVLLVQEDVFFPVPTGRLKLRKFATGAAELISYNRADTDSLRPSEWMTYHAIDPVQLEQVLEMSLGRGVTVRKRRFLYKVGHTRIHLDQVENLGDFVELEVVLPQADEADESALGRAKVIANDLIQRLKLDAEQRVMVAYADLLTPN